MPTRTRSCSSTRKKPAVVVDLDTTALKGVPVGAVLAAAREAMAGPSLTREAIWAMAQYLDLASPGFIPKDRALFTYCQTRLEEYVARHALDPGMGELWGRADCLSRMYRKVLRQAEQRINERVAARAARVVRPLAGQAQDAA